MNRNVTLLSSHFIKIVQTQQMTPMGNKQQAEQQRTQKKAFRATQKVYYGLLFMFQNTVLRLQTDRQTHTVIIVPAARWDNEEFSLTGVQVFSVQGRSEKKKAYKRDSA